MLPFSYIYYANTFFSYHFLIFIYLAIYLLSHATIYLCYFFLMLSMLPSSYFTIFLYLCVAILLHVLMFSSSSVTALTLYSNTLSVARVTKDKQYYQLIL